MCETLEAIAERLGQGVAEHPGWRATLHADTNRKVAVTLPEVKWLEDQKRRERRNPSR